MGFFGRIGQKLTSAARLGGKLLSGASRMGTKLAGGAERAMGTIAGLPVVGAAIGSNPLFQGMRGVVSGVARTSKYVGQAGQILEKAQAPTSVASAYSTAKKLRSVGARARTAGMGTYQDVRTLADLRKGDRKDQAGQPRGVGNDTTLA